MRENVRTNWIKTPKEIPTSLLRGHGEWNVWLTPIGSLEKIPRRLSRNRIIKMDTDNKLLRWFSFYIGINFFTTNCMRLCRIKSYLMVVTIFGRYYARKCKTNRIKIPKEIPTSLLKGNREWNVWLTPIGPLEKIPRRG